MAQVAITQAEVNAAAQALVAAGIHPSVRRVREQLGRGSMTTITSMLGQVRADLPVPAAPRPSTIVTMVVPPAANDRLLELERELAEERGRTAELRAQLAKVEVDRDQAVVQLADAQAKAKTAKAEAAAANRARDKAEEAVEREALARAAAEEQIHRAQKFMTNDAAHIARLRAYLEAYGGAETLAQAERGEAPADTDQLAAVAKAAQADEASRPKPKARPARRG